MREEEAKVEESYYVASQWQLMWRKLIKHKLAIFGGTILVIFYFVAIFCEFLSPYDIYKGRIEYIYCSELPVSSIIIQNRAFTTGLFLLLHVEESVEFMLRNILFLLVSMSH